MTEPIAIRPARRGDLDAIFAIYNVEVAEGTATFDTEPRTRPADDEWLSDRDPALHPVLVAERGEAVLGWASLGPWSSKGAYRRSAEVSVYVDGAARGGGVGARLLAALIEGARGTDVAILIARIAEGNPVSVHLHEQAGFERVGILRRSGEKFGRVLDVEVLDLHLDGE